jgi:hypothetical protein
MKSQGGSDAKGKKRAGRASDDTIDIVDATPHPNTVINASNAYKGLADGRNVLPFVIAEKIDNAIAATKVSANACRPISGRLSRCMSQKTHIQPQRFAHVSSCRAGKL